MRLDTPLFLLAFDHRQSLVRGLFGGDERRATRLGPDVKLLVLEGLRVAVAEGLALGGGRVGVLVDDRFGAAAAAGARESGFITALAVERSGRREVAYEHGSRGFAAAVESVAPHYAKVLVRYNAEDPDAAMNARQRALLAGLSDWCTQHEPDLLLELLVPPTDAQLAACGGSHARFDADVRPGLVARAMAELQDAGVAPALWKIEGLEDEAAARAIAAQAQAGPVPAPCLVLGRGADDAKVDHWLAVAAPIAGFAGFAIGRSIWWDAARRWLAGEVSSAQASATIATAYRRAVASYLLAAGARR